jgi:protein SCO1/2
MSCAGLLVAGCHRQAGVCTSCCDTNETAVATPAEPSAATATNAGPTNFFFSDWIEPAQRTPLKLTHEATRQDNTAVALRDLVGQPLAVSFVYTRCSNPNKCRLVTTTMGNLRRKLEADGLLNQVKLILITYDAQYDTPKVMREYAGRNGLNLDEHALFLRPAVDAQHNLFRDLGVSASFNAGGVTMHGIQLLLVDKAGRLARTYRTLIWDNDQVAKDLARLAHE